jgi:hypothetical protein
LGRGDGTFQAAVSYAAGSAPYSVAVGDFNGDGIPDLAVANVGSDNVSVLLGHGDGTFGPAVNYGVGISPRSVAVGDFNGDGVPDLAVVYRGGVRVLLGNGDGTFQTTPTSYVAGSVPASVAVGDFNGDGLPDFAVANSSSNDVSILLNDSIWPLVRGGATRPSGGKGLAKVRLNSDSFVASSPIVSAPGQPNGIAPSSVARQALLASPRLLDSLWLAWPREERTPTVSGTFPVRHEDPNANRWHRQESDLDALGKGLAMLAWEES